jgi:hypothetical protein
MTGLGMARIEVWVESTNPNAVARLMELLARAEPIGTDDYGHLHTTELTVFAGEVMWGQAVTCEEQAVRDGEISALVRLTADHGPEHRLVARGVYAMAARLLLAVEITDPGALQPLSVARALALVKEMGELPDYRAADLAPRDWVVAQVYDACERMVRSWLSRLETTAIQMTKRHREATPTWRETQGAYEAAAKSWPAGLERIQTWLSPST